jgi:hypothetical protein
MHLCVCVSVCLCVCVSVCLCLCVCVYAPECMMHLSNLVCVSVSVSMSVYLSIVCVRWCQSVSICLSVSTSECLESVSLSVSACLCLYLCQKHDILSTFPMCRCIMYVCVYTHIICIGTLSQDVSLQGRGDESLRHSHCRPQAMRAPPRCKLSQRVVHAYILMMMMMKRRCLRLRAAKCRNAWYMLTV